MQRSLVVEQQTLGLTETTDSFAAVVGYSVHLAVAVTGKVLWLKPQQLVVPEQSVDVLSLTVAAVELSLGMKLLCHRLPFTYAP